MTHVTVLTCTDCRLPIAVSDVVLRSISSSLTPVAFHERCYKMHVPAQRGPVDDVL